MQKMRSKRCKQERAPTKGDETKDGARGGCQLLFSFPSLKGTSHFLPPIKFNIKCTYFNDWSFWLITSFPFLAHLWSKRNQSEASIFLISDDISCHKKDKENRHLCYRCCHCYNCNFNYPLLRIVWLCWSWTWTWTSEGPDFVTCGVGKNSLTFKGFAVFKK